MITRAHTHMHTPVCIHTLVLTLLLWMRNKRGQGQADDWGSQAWSLAGPTGQGPEAGGPG